MPAYVPTKRAVAYRTEVSLVDQSNTKLFKTTPTLAAGDVKVSIDNGALANITTLPSESPAGSGIVKVDLSATEMTGDLIVVMFHDAAGAEWADLLLKIATEDLLAGSSYVAPDNASIAAIKVKTDQLAFTLANKVDASIQAAGDFAQGAADKVWLTASRTLTAFSFAVDLSTTALAAIWDRATSALTTVGSIGKLIVDNLNTPVSTRADQTTVNA